MVEVIQGIWHVPQGGGMIHVDIFQGGTVMAKGMAGAPLGQEAIPTHARGAHLLVNRPGRAGMPMLAREGDLDFL